MRYSLALGELALFAGALEAELLAFAFAVVAAEQVGAFERGFEIFVQDHQSFADTQADRLYLAFVPAAGNDGADVELADVIEHLEWLLQLGQHVFAVGEVLAGRLAVDGDVAFAGGQAYPGGGAFAAAQAVEIIIGSHYFASLTDMTLGFWASWLCSLPS
jgi:hypothetical protein